MKRILGLVSPILVLLAATFCACLAAYLITLIFGDAVSFRTTFKRFSQLFLVLSIFPLMHLLKLNRFDIGILGGASLLKQLVQGFGIGFVTLFPVLAIIYSYDVYVIDETKLWTLAWLSKKLIIEFLLALLISFVEEPVFRGMLLTGFSKQFSTRTAIAVSAFYYALLHFVNSNIEIPSQEVKIYSGFILLGDAFAQLLNFDYLSPFSSLFVVGIFLGVLKTQVPASLGLCIGCHAGWVWQIKLSKLFFNINPDSDYLFLVSTYDGVIGLMVTCWLTLAIAAYLGYRKFFQPVDAI